MSLSSTEDRSSKYILLTGQSLEKGEVEPILRSVSRDKEIKELINETRWISRHRRSLEILVSVLAAFIILYILQFTGPAANYVKTIIIVGAGTIAIEVIFSKVLDYLASHWIAGQFEPLTEEFPLDVFELWRPEVSALSDAQCALMAELKTHSGVSMIHSNWPYFDRFFLYSLTLQFLDEDTWKTAKEAYKKEFKKYAEDIIDNVRKLLGTSTKNDPHHETSWQVFGITFASRFIYRLYEEEAKKRSEKNNLKFSFYLDKNFSAVVDKKEDSSDNNAIGSAVLEFLKLVTSPEIASISANEEEQSKDHSNIPVGVIKTEIIKGKARETEITGGIQKIFNRMLQKILKWNQNHKDKTITIPVRRWISIPKRDWIGSNKSDGLQVIGIGGIEHNLALLYYINKFRWEGGKTFVGIKENEFDKNRHRENKNCVLLSAERRVEVEFGDNDVHSGPTHKNEALAIKFSIEQDKQEYQFLWFCGLGGPATKISFLKYLYEPEILQETGAYLFEIGPRDKYNEFLDRWDALDATNNPNNIEVRELLKRSITVTKKC